MRNLDSEPKDFKELGFGDKDMTMFTMTDLRLEKIKEQVHMMITMKRKIQMELLTTYLPTLLLLSISYATTFFKPEYFEASLTVNLTIMLVMTTIFTTKIAELPPTSDMKMLDIWLIFCLFVPFALSIVQTAIECYRDDEVCFSLGTMLVISDRSSIRHIIRIPHICHPRHPRLQCKFFKVRGILSTKKGRNVRCV